MHSEAAAPYKSVSTKVSEAEFAALEERARAAGLTLSEWVRDVLLSAPVDGGPEVSGSWWPSCWPRGRCS